MSLRRSVPGVALLLLPVAGAAQVHEPEYHVGSSLGFRGTRIGMLGGRGGFTTSPYTELEAEAALSLLRTTSCELTCHDQYEVAPAGIAGLNIQLGTVGRVTPYLRGEAGLLRSRGEWSVLLGGGAGGRLPLRERTELFTELVGWTPIGGESRVVGLSVGLRLDLERPAR